MEPTLTFTGSATSFTAGDLSTVVATGSSQAEVRFKNISDVSVKVWYRKTGTSGAGENTDITPLESSGNITIALTTAKTIEYYVEGGGTIECWVVDFGGSGVVTSTVSVADIRTTLLDSGYSTSDIADAAIQGYIDMINAEVTDAATRHANIAGYTLNSSIKTNAIKYGALWQTLNLLRTKGAAQGLAQNRIIVDSETILDYKEKYEMILDGIQSGIKYGA